MWWQPRQWRLAKPFVLILRSTANRSWKTPRRWPVSLWMVAVLSCRGVRTPAATTRGFGVAEFQETGRLMVQVLDALAAGGDSSAVEAEVKAKVEALTARFPIYG